MWQCRFIVLCILHINFHLFHRLAELTDILLQILLGH